MNVITIPDTSALDAENNPLVASAKAMEISNKEQHGIALLIFDKLAKREKECTKFFSDLKEPINKARQALLDKEHAVLDPLKEAKAIVSRKAAAWTIEQERLAKEQEAALAAQAQKDSEDRLLAEAELLQAEGSKEQAEDLLNQPQERTIVKVEAEVATVKGIGTTTRWHAVVLDKMKLIQFVAKNPAWIHLLDANLPTLNRLAQAQKEQLEKSIEGVRAVKESGLSRRGT